MPSSLPVLASGFTSGAALIVAIGSQNAFVLRQGLRREHVLALVVFCALSDAALIALGLLGVGALVEAAPLAVEIVRWLGAAFLIAYGVLAAHRAARGEALSTDHAPRRTGLAATLLTAAALTWLNPHVYLDTVVLLGSLGTAHGDQSAWFGVGAAAASLVWFAALGFGARLLAPFMARPSAWRVLDALVAVTMLVLAVLLIARR